MDQILNIKLKEYLERISSKSPNCGGGVCCALLGSQATSLLLMCLKFSKDNIEETHYQILLTQYQDSLGKFVEYSAQDQEDLNRLISHYKTDKGQLNWSYELKLLKLKCTEAPLKVMKESMALLREIEVFFPRCNAHIVSDLKISAHFFYAAIQSSMINIEINSIEGDTKYEETYNEAQSILIHSKTAIRELRLIQ